MVQYCQRFPESLVRLASTQVVYMQMHGFIMDICWQIVCMHYHACIVFDMGYCCQSTALGNEHIKNPLPGPHLHSMQGVAIQWKGQPVLHCDGWWHLPQKAREREGSWRNCPGRNLHDIDQFEHDFFLGQGYPYLYIRKQRSILKVVFTPLTSPCHAIWGQNFQSSTSFAASKPGGHPRSCAVTGGGWI